MIFEVVKGGNVRVDCTNPGQCIQTEDGTVYLRVGFDKTPCKPVYSIKSYGPANVMAVLRLHDAALTGLENTQLVRIVKVKMESIGGN